MDNTERPVCISNNQRRAARAGNFDHRIIDRLRIKSALFLDEAADRFGRAFPDAARRGVLSGFSSIGRFFLALALGATFALVYVASVTVLIDRVQAISDALNILIPR